MSMRSTFGSRRTPVACSAEALFQPQAPNSQRHSTPQVKILKVIASCPLTDVHRRLRWLWYPCSRAVSVGMFQSVAAGSVWPTQRNDGDMPVLLGNDTKFVHRVKLWSGMSARYLRSGGRDEVRAESRDSLPNDSAQTAASRPARRASQLVSDRVAAQHCRLTAYVASAQEDKRAWTWTCTRQH